MNVTWVIGLLLLILAVASLLIGRRVAGGERARRPPDAAELEALGNEAVERARKDVEKFGWHFVLIPGEGGSGFLFTIGLWQTWKHPEIIAFSPTDDPERIVGRFSAVAKRIAAGERFEPGKTYEGLFGDFPGAFRAVHADRYEDYLGTAAGFYQSFDFPVQQLFWPDREGRFPWETGFDQRIRGLQPLLYEA